MHAKEAKIIQEGNIGHIIKNIRKIIEKNDYSQYGELHTSESLSPHQVKALKELGYTVEIRDTIGWYNKKTVIGW